MCKLQYLLGRSLVVLGVTLLLGGWAQTDSAGAEHIFLGGADIAKAMSNPQDSAMIDFVVRRLPGNDAVWYVVVLKVNTGNTKRLEIVEAFGRNAAAVQIAKFLQQNPKLVRHPQSFRRWLNVEMYPNEWLAGLRYQAISNYARQKGYR